jgi:hypothetical protein
LSLRRDGSEDFWCGERVERSSEFPAEGPQIFQRRESKQYDCNKEVGEARGSRQFRDLKAKRNPKGGVTTIPTVNLKLNTGLNLTGGSTGGSKGPTLGSITITKGTDAASTNLLQGP